MAHRKLALYLLSTLTLIFGCANQSPSFRIIESGSLGYSPEAFGFPKEIESVVQLSNDLFGYFVAPYELFSKEKRVDGPTFAIVSKKLGRTIATLSETQLTDNFLMSGIPALTAGSNVVFVSQLSAKETELTSISLDTHTTIRRKFPKFLGMRKLEGSSEWIAAFTSARNGVFVHIIDKSLVEKYRFEAPWQPEVPDFVLFNGNHFMYYTFSAMLGDTLARNPNSTETKLVEEVGQSLSDQSSAIVALRDKVRLRIVDGELMFFDGPYSDEKRIYLDVDILQATLIEGSREILAVSRTKYFLIRY